MAKAHIPTPKQQVAGRTGVASWYNFYAGYSCDFVRHTIHESGLRPGSVILDPWNGAGTTTQVAAELGYESIGVDVNPAVTIVARARSIGLGHSELLRDASERVLDKEQRVEMASISSDPLLLWMCGPAVLAIRRIVATILARTWPEHTACEIVAAPGAIPYATAFLIAALFRTLRKLIAPFIGSNPTWIRKPKSGSTIDVQPAAVFERFDVEVAAMLKSYSDAITDLFASQNSPAPRLVVATATNIPVADRSVDMVIGSPPYCTRVDYAVSMSIELAVLGMHPDRELRELRLRMTGTTAIRPRHAISDAGWGKTCQALLAEIERHQSKASSSYYYKTHIQYFEDLYRALGEIHRCLKPGGSAVIVVQDSFYKEVHNDLPMIVTEMAAELGWLKKRSDVFQVEQNMVRINRNAKKYRRTAEAREVALWLQKPQS